MKIEIEGLKRGYRQSMGYIAGAGIASIFVMIINGSWKLFFILLIMHPTIWSLLALIIYKVDEKRNQKRD